MRPLRRSRIQLNWFEDAVITERIDNLGIGNPIFPISSSIQKMNSRLSITWLLKQWIIV